MREDKEQLIRDFEKVYTARYRSPAEKKREATLKALHEVWQEHDREKAAKARKAAKTREEKGKK